MSHVDPPTDPPQDPPSGPPAPPAQPPATPPPAPPAEPPKEPHNDGERMDKMEGMIGNIMDAVSGLTNAIANGGDRESQPQKRPWTHWGTKK